MSHHQDDLNEKLVEYIKDAHAMERNSLMMLRSMLLNTADPEMRGIIEHHVTETERHGALLLGRLEELGENVGRLKEGGALISSMLKGVADQIRPDKPGRNARDGYVTEHLEIAAYELLSRFADRAGDATTAELARRNLAEEKVMADALASTWDKVIDLTVEETVAS